MKNKIILLPGDYIVLHPGLRIENTSGNMVIRFDIPSVLDISAVINKKKEEGK